MFLIKLAVRSNPVNGEVYSIQRYVISFVSNLRQVGCFCPGTPESSTNKTDRHDIAEIWLKVVLNTINTLIKFIIFFSSKNTFNILHILQLNCKIISSRVQYKHKKKSLIIQNALYKVDTPDSCINHGIYRTYVCFSFVNISLQLYVNKKLFFVIIYFTLIGS